MNTNTQGNEIMTEDFRKSMTVREMIVVLQSLPQDLEVEMGMNQEYQCRVNAEDITIQEYDGREYVFIGD